MGEVVDMILEGLLCEVCGAWIDDNSIGEPRKCVTCDPRRRKSPRSRKRAKKVRQGERGTNGTD